MKKAGFIIVIAALFLAGCASTPPSTTQTAHASQTTQAAAQTAQPVAQGTQFSAQTAQPAAETQAASSSPATIEPPPETTEVAPAAPRSSLLSAEALGIYRDAEELQQPPSDDELAVVASAKTLIGKPPNAKVTVNGKGFTLDCIGTVSAIYYGLSLDVTKDFALYTGNGVNRLYMTLKERNALHKDAYPRPGDVIIWDNTWDVGGDGDRVHDPRTHAGIVLAVDEDGTIHYVHENLYKGIMIEVMNLLRPTVARDEQGKLINSGLAIATKTGGPLPAHTLSGDVFNCFGDVLGSRDYFFVDLAQQQETGPGDAAEVALQGSR